MTTNIFVTRLTIQMYNTSGVVQSMNKRQENRKKVSLLTLERSRMYSNEAHRRCQFSCIADESDSNQTMHHIVASIGRLVFLPRIHRTCELHIKALGRMYPPDLQ